MSLARMLSPAPTTTIIDPRLDPATVTPLRLVGSIAYNQEKGYNLEWESRADFQTWLRHEQKAQGIKIQIAKTHLSKVQQVYLTCETFRCAHNGCGGVKRYVKKTTWE
jgi:hypothetical protein